MSDIRKWLDDLGLGEYAEAFEAEKIDIAALPHVSEADLKDMGLPIGPRRKVLAAVADLSHLNKVTDGPPNPAVAEKELVGAAERRQITVLFCDLVGSTALSEQLDPEDLRTLMASYQKNCGAVVERYDGHIAQYLGDGIMVYFGWPRAHEDDAERAVRASLEMIDAVKTMPAPAPLQVRIGIATGPVVVGEDAGDAEANKLAVGETPNLAARLQGLAGPDQIVIGPGTHRLLGGVFDYDDLGARNLKGIVEPVQVWRVKGASAAEGRFEAHTAGGLTPFVGRGSELQLLLDRWRQSRDGEGQVVLLSGEPGIGKSRMIKVLRERLSSERHVRLRYQCSPYHANSAFHPIVEQLARAARFDRDDGVDAKLDKLETLLCQSAEDVPKVAPLFAAMLSLPLDRYPLSNLSPQRQKEDTIATLADQTVALSSQHPVLMIVEDAHWIDPTTLEVLSRVIDRIQDAAVLLVITYRPGFEPPWTGQGHVTLHSLNRLGRRQGTDMVNKVTGGKALPGEVLDEIIAKTDGVPLFVEELTKNVLEAGFLKERGAVYVLDGSLPPLAIPATLQDSLMARLDRLPTVKEVAQIGACIGRKFSYELLAAITPLGDSELEDALSELAASELVFRRGTPPDATYVFKHALVQDAAYESLLKSRRQQFHASIAETLKTRFPDTDRNEPELLAHHYTEAGLTHQAINYWLKAGKRASDRSANIEAISHLKKGLNLVLADPDGRERDRRELEIQVALGPPVMAISGFSADETGRVYARALDLCRKFENTPQIFQVLYGVSIHQAIQGNHLKARDLAKEMAEQADQHADLAARSVAHRLYGAVLYYLGDLSHARDELECALTLYDAELHRSVSSEYGHDPGVFASVYLSLVLAILGYQDRALNLLRDGIAYAEELKHPHTTAMAICHATYFYYYLREPGAALAQADAALKLALEQNFSHWEASARIYVGWAQAQEYPDKGMMELEQGLKQARTMQSRAALPLFLDTYADACLKGGRTSEALAAVAEGLAIVQKHGEGWGQEAELRRLRAEILLTGSDPQQAEAEACLRQALDVARSQEAKLWELRATMSLARLRQSQGKRQEAHDLLFPVYDWFTEGFGTADLKDAKALLDELN